MTAPDQDAIAAAGDELQNLTQHLSRLFIGQHDLVRDCLVALLAGGHILVESVPGLGKTLLTQAIGHLLGLQTGRIQFTADLMPSDITGSHLFDLAERRFVFRHGPVFCQFLLADEFNRAPAKTHAALLECMQESQVTVDGSRYVLPPPFLVMATQNPIEQEGTYALPEAQLDRFLFKVVLDYPSQQEEERILHLFLSGGSPAKTLANELPQLATPARLLQWQELTAQITVDESIITYITGLVRASRNFPGFYLGGSPRAGISLLRGGRALALLRGRSFVVPDDIADILLPAMRHRVILSPEAEIEGQRADDLLTALMKEVPVPRGVDARAVGASQV